MSKQSMDIVMENRHKLVEQIIKNMESGKLIFNDPFIKSYTRPYNPISGARYKGGNFVELAITSEIRGYKDPRWMTYKQAQSKDYKIKPGSKGVQLEKFIFEKKIKEKNEDTGLIEERTIRLARPIATYFVVFNAEQIDGIEKLEELPKIDISDSSIYKLTRNLMASSECTIIEADNDRACYIPSKDIINLPEKDRFVSAEAYLGTAVHEMIHSTGCFNRLNRNIENKFGSPDYAMEELRAELGAFFVESDLGVSIGAEHINSHAAYLQSWIKALKDDPNELFRACNDADKAAERINSNYTQYNRLEPLRKFEKHLELLSNKDTKESVFYKELLEAVDMSGISNEEDVAVKYDNEHFGCIAIGNKVIGFQCSLSEKGGESFINIRNIVSDLNIDFHTQINQLGTSLELEM